MRDGILIALALKGQSHASELARALGASVPGVWTAVQQLEKDGLIAATAHGRTRTLQLNPRWYAKAQLRELLERMGEARPELYQTLATVRGRPRRTGKAG
jgi:biotin operon repressor